MNTLKTFALTVAVVAAAAATASAGPVGTAKARGDYRPFWQTQMAQYAPAHHSHQHHFMTHSSAPIRVVAPIHASHANHASYATANHWALQKTDVHKIN